MTKDLLNIKSFDRRRVLQDIAGGFAAAGSTTLFAPAWLLELETRILWRARLKMPKRA